MIPGLSFALVPESAFETGKIYSCKFGLKFLPKSECSKNIKEIVYGGPLSSSNILVTIPDVINGGYTVHVDTDEDPLCKVECSGPDLYSCIIAPLANYKDISIENRFDSDGDYFIDSVCIPGASTFDHETKTQRIEYRWLPKH